MLLSPRFRNAAAAEHSASELMELNPPSHAFVPEVLRTYPVFWAMPTGTEPAPQKAAEAAPAQHTTASSRHATGDEECRVLFGGTTNRIARPRYTYELELV